MYSEGTDGKYKCISSDESPKPTTCESSTDKKKQTKEERMDEILCHTFQNIDLNKRMENEFRNETENYLRYINRRIEKEFCYETVMELTDEKLLDTYLKKSDAVKKSISRLDNVLSKYVNEEVKDKILQEYILGLIPPGAKGNARGNRFNKIIKEKINSFNLDKEKFEVYFEKECEKNMTHERPDWYITQISTGRTIIGMNQLDLWGGGHQSNRGSKYLFNNQNNGENSKLLCVVCNKTQIKSSKNKIFKLFKVGFENNTLCYINNIQNIIYTYFNLN